MSTSSLSDAWSEIGHAVGSGLVHVVDGDIHELSLRELRFISTYIRFACSLVNVPGVEISSITFASERGVLIRITLEKLQNPKIKQKVFKDGETASLRDIEELLNFAGLAEQMNELYKKSTNQFWCRQGIEIDEERQ